MFLMADITISADSVAWYGAIVATASVLVAVASAGFTGYAVFRDRARLKVTVQHNMKLLESYGNYSENEVYTVITAANVGRRPIRLGMVSFSLKGEKTGGYILKGQWEPSGQLAESESATQLAKESGIDWEQIRYVNVQTATGRVWRCRIRPSSPRKAR